MLFVKLCASDLLQSAENSTRCLHQLPCSCSSGAQVFWMCSCPAHTAYSEGMHQCILLLHLLKALSVCSSPSAAGRSEACVVGWGDGTGAAGHLEGATTTDHPAAVSELRSPRPNCMQAHVTEHVNEDLSLMCCLLSSSSPVLWKGLRPSIRLQCLSYPSCTAALTFRDYTGRTRSWAPSMGCCWGAELCGSWQDSAELLSSAHTGTHDSWSTCGVGEIFTNTFRMSASLQMFHNILRHEDTTYCFYRHFSKEKLPFIFKHPLGQMYQCGSVTTLSSAPIKCQRQKTNIWDAKTENDASLRYLWNDHLPWGTDYRHLCFSG